MTRFLLALVLTLAATAATAAGLPPQLKDTSTVSAEVIRLGDIWDGLPADKAATPVANAPQPGKRVMLEARWLGAVAQAYGVDWQPSSAFQRVNLERAGAAIDVKAVETELREALTMEGAPAEATIEIANRSALAIVVPANGPTDVLVRDVAWDARTSRFSANVEAPAGQPNAVHVRITGRLLATTRLPVLRHVMSRGSVIGEGDVEWVEVSESLVRGDVATDASDLVGKEPRWQLRAGAPVRMAEVRRPVLVERNSLVTMTLQTPFMRLTTQGKALEDGGKGDVVRITNLHTKRTVEGTVEGPGTVAVSLGGPVALAN